MNISSIVAIVSALISLISPLFVILAYIKNERKEQVNYGRNEGQFTSEIEYIKTRIDKIEKNTCKEDEQYKNLVERLAKVEIATENVVKMVEKI